MRACNICAATENGGFMCVSVEIDDMWRSAWLMMGQLTGIEASKPKKESAIVLRALFGNSELS